MNDTTRNLLILAAVALLGVVFFEQFSVTAGVLSLLLSIAFTIGIGYAIWLWYKNRQGTISLMPAKWRTLLQVCIVGAYLVFATGLMYPGWAGWGPAAALTFFVLLAGLLVGVYYAWQQRSAW